jgi:hypothetical protein
MKLLVTVSQRRPVELHLEVMEAPQNMYSPRNSLWSHGSSTWSLQGLTRWLRCFGQSNWTTTKGIIWCNLFEGKMFQVAPWWWWNSKALAQNKSEWRIELNQKGQNYKNTKNMLTDATCSSLVNPDHNYGDTVPLNHVSFTCGRSSYLWCCSKKEKRARVYKTNNPARFNYSYKEVLVICLTVCHLSVCLALFVTWLSASNSLPLDVYLKLSATWLSVQNSPLHDCLPRTFHHETVCLNFSATWLSASYDLWPSAVSLSVSKSSPRDSLSHSLSPHIVRLTLSVTWPSSSYSGRQKNRPRQKKRPTFHSNFSVQYWGFPN